MFYWIFRVLDRMCFAMDMGASGSYTKCNIWCENTFQIFCSMCLGCLAGVQTRRIGYVLLDEWQILDLAISGMLFKT